MEFFLFRELNCQPKRPFSRMRMAVRSLQTIIPFPFQLKSTEKDYFCLKKKNKLHVLNLGII